MIANDDSTPPILYHYTDAAGLLGIVHQPRFDDGYSIPQSPEPSRTLKLRATDVRFMNDSAELRHAGAAFATRFREVAEESQNTDRIAAILRQLADEFDSAEAYGEPVQMFAACLTENGDQLNQWRGYAGGMGGYSIGINRIALNHFTFAMPVSPNRGQVELGKLPNELGPQQVSYDPTTVSEEAERLARWVQRTPEKPAFYEELGEEFWGRWNSVGAMALLKHHDFHEEREWRILSRHAPNSRRGSLPTEFRVGRMGVIPFISIAVNLEAAPDIAVLERLFGPRPRTIDDLVVGPSPDQALRVSAAKQLLETNGHDPSVVRASPIPFRG